MAKENKQLLLTDLCTRLPYKTMVKCITDYRHEFDEELSVMHIMNFYQFDIKPYLRPMSSMSEEEKKELKELHFYYTDGHIVNDEDKDFKPIIVDEVHCFCIIDWLNAHHFDYCGLIDKGLAIEALCEGCEYRYKIKEK